MPPSSTRIWIYRLLVPVLAVALPLLVCELGLRLRGYDPLAEMRAGRGAFVRPSNLPDVHYELRPGAAGRAWGTEVRINSEGFRGPEIDLNRRRGQRIVVLGDSVAFGNRLPAGQELPALLAAGLEARGLDGEVLNLAVTGYDITQEVAALEARLPRLRPDLVILQYCMNDAGIHTVNLEFTSTLEGLERVGWLGLRAVQWLVLFDDARLRSNAARDRNSPEVFRREFAHLIAPIAAEERELRARMASVSARWPSSWYAESARIGRLRHAFEWLAALAKPGDFELLAVVLPVLETDRGEFIHAAAEDLVSAELQRAGIPEVDVRNAFHRMGLQTLRLAPDDSIHPNAAGHRLLALALLEALAARAEVPPEGAPSNRPGPA